MSAEDLRGSVDDPAGGFFFDGFESGLDPAWTRYGVRGDGELVRTPRGQALELSAGAKIGEEVGKACLVYPFPAPLQSGDEIDVAAAFRLPAIAGGRISLIDIECKWCGVATQPGIRLFLDLDRTLYLERGKLGHAGSFRQRGGPSVPVDEWVLIRWQARLGQGGDGRSTVWLDGREVLGEQGANFPDQAVADRYGITLEAEQYDRVQVGITANSQPEPVTILIDDVEIALGGGAADARPGEATNGAQKGRF